ncbi:hypothetical protein N431DRAFT_60319 [Stipitochalara longipes BDJ]|nr:hypothetical protein N431DRAFT_60319 [Stipitochalara longipes BDJ]
MEKLELLTVAVNSKPRQTWKLAKLRLFSFVAALGLLWYTNRDQRREWLPLGKSSLKPGDDFSWSGINPSEHLIYTSCFGFYQCARLSVPLDWNSTSSNGSRVAIAVIKLPAPVPVTDANYGGAVLLNPGGPGGSGVDFLLRDGRNISAIVSPLSSTKTPPEGKYFDLISWDPRGVNNTTPGLNCFKDSLSYDVWRYQEQADGLDHTSDISLSLVWARSKALMETCAQDDKISKHMNTVLVTRDMIEIIERHAEWRGKQAEKWLASRAGKLMTIEKQEGDPYSRDTVIDRTKWRKGDEKLQYWGFSYGTILGATFAAIYPSRVERVVLDGVADAHNYYSTDWVPNLLDTDKVMLRFYDYCSQAGADNCAMNTNNASSSSIQYSIESFLSSLREDPISVPGNNTRGPTIITYSDLMAMFRVMLYRPLEYFTQMAELLADVVHGNGTAFAVYKQTAQKRTCPFGEIQGEHGSSCKPLEWGIEIAAAILCSDGKDVINSTKADFRATVKALYQQSKFLGEFWSTIALSCNHWTFRPKWGITGDEIKGDTLHPILWIGNTLDPVTPLADAHASSKRFPGSVVLQQDSEGHCSLSSPSKCTEGVVRNYFQTGDLPATGTICQPDERPFIGHVSGL